MTMRYAPFRTTTLAVLTTAGLLASAACGGSGFDSDSASTQQSSGPASLQILIASSGDAETKAVTDAATAWAGSSGNKATVTTAQDIAQQLGQAFAGGNPPDVFYVDAARFADYASVGALEPYGDKVTGVDDFYPSLRKSFTYKDKLYCVPKDFSTLAMEINTDLWAKAGLSTADVPTTWEQLTAAGQKLKAKGITPIALGDTRDRIGAFMVQAGGWVVDQNATRATADTPENLQALQYVQSLLKDGLAKYPKQLDSGWSGEAFGKAKAAITFEGNWIEGAMKADYPAVKYTVNPMPAGPKGQGTLAFTQCWGIAAKSTHKDQAIKFVEAMTTGQQQLAFAKGFGVMPSRQSAKDQYTAQFPTDKPFVDGAAYAQGPVNAPKMDSVLADFDTGLQQLATGDPKALLARVQKNTQAVLGG
jgi:multiple sugar transport system substrate-binding protein